VAAHIYLVRDGADLVCHCRCERALVCHPCQVACPWCGCGWLFACADCRKAFTFARGVLVDEPWEELARRDFAPFFPDEPPTAEDIDEWVESMQALLSDVEVGVRYVYLDGALIRADAREIAIDGFYARHVARHVPHVAALDDHTILERTLANRKYWLAHAIDGAAPQTMH
jgi:hypothetical protein